MNLDIENIDDEEEDVLIRMQHDNGIVVTFLSAPSSVFETTDKIDALTFWTSPESVFVAINGDLLEEMIKDSVEKNSGIYSAKEAGYLPIIHILNIGLKKVNRQIAEREEKR